MNPKEENAADDGFFVEEDDDSDYCIEDAEQIVSVLTSASEEAKEFSNAVVETGVLDAAQIGILQSKQDWRYFTNKVVDETLEINVSDTSELWEYFKHILALLRKEPDDNNDEEIVAHNDLLSVSGCIDRIIAHFIDQMSEESILEILEYCENRIASSKRNNESTISLLLRTFEYKTLPSKFVLPLAFGLDGVPFIKSFLIIQKKYHEVPLNAPSFFKRITDVDDPIVFRALGCGAFSDEEHMTYNAFDFSFSKIKEHISNYGSTKAERIRSEEWVTSSMLFIRNVCERTGQFNDVALDFLAIAKDGSLFVKLESLKFFDCFFSMFDCELALHLLRTGLISLLYNTIISNTKTISLIPSIKLLASVKDFLESRCLSFSDVDENGEIDEDDLYETLLEISTNTDDEMIQQIIASILPEDM
jgi:hypothetical protein